jgi:hypothetical protein
MRWSLIATSAAILLMVCACPTRSFAESDRQLAERCTDKLYSFIHGRSESSIVENSGSVFNYEYAASIAASRNKKNWKNFTKSQKEAYLKQLRTIAARQVIPRLKAGITRGTVVRTFRENGLLVIVYKSGSRMKVSNSCMVHDGTSAGVSISTLAAEALKDKKH